MRYLWLVLLLSLPCVAQAATLTAASCENKVGQTDVQDKLTAAANGDTVVVPAGTCTWTTSPSLAGKGVVFTGAGIGVTNITLNGSLFGMSFSGLSATNFVDISGFTFIKQGNFSSRGMIELSANPIQTVNGFRFHHNRMLVATSGSRGIVPTAIFGLIDNNIIDVTATSGAIQMISIFGANISLDPGHTPWSQPLTLGTDKAVYVEDNTITYDVSDTGVEDSIDAYAGARFVVRHNRINNISIGFHGTDSGGQRSPVSFEVYSNIFTNNSTTKIRAGTVRGGTGVWFNNTYGGTVPTGWNGINLLPYRACADDRAGYGWGACDGTQWKLVSGTLSSGNSRICSAVGTFGFSVAAPDAVPICTHGSGDCTLFFDGAGTGGYPCRDQPGVGPGQVVEPIYAWDNGSITIGPTDSWLNNCGGLGIANYLQADRDYINNGITPKPGYTAYTYPHPLQGVVLPDPTTNPRFAPALNLRRVAYEEQ